LPCLVTSYCGLRITITSDLSPSSHISNTVRKSHQAQRAVAAPGYHSWGKGSQRFLPLWGWFTVTIKWHSTVTVKSIAIPIRT